MANPAPGFTQHPKYRVDIETQAAHLQVRVDATVIADSKRAVVVRETRHHAVWYIPFDDVDSQFTVASITTSYCPFKGTANYWSIALPDRTIEDAIWSYKQPYDECGAIANYASFYTNKVDLFIDGQFMNNNAPRSI